MDQYRVVASEQVFPPYISERLGNSVQRFAPCISLGVTKKSDEYIQMRMSLRSDRFSLLEGQKLENKWHRLQHWQLVTPQLSWETTSEQSNIVWKVSSIKKKKVIHWFVSKLVQCLECSLRLFCLDPFKIFIYTFSLSSLLYTFQFLLGTALNAWAQATCKLMQPRPE